MRATIVGMLAAALCIVGTGSLLRAQEAGAIDAEMVNRAITAGVEYL